MSERLQVQYRCPLCGDVICESPAKHNEWFHGEPAPPAPPAAPLETAVDTIFANHMETAQKLALAESELEKIQDIIMVVANPDNWYRDVNGWKWLPTREDDSEYQGGVAEYVRERMRKAAQESDNRSKT